MKFITVSVIVSSEVLDIPIPKKKRSGPKPEFSFNAKNISTLNSQKRFCNFIPNFLYQRADKTDTGDETSSQNHYE